MIQQTVLTLLMISQVAGPPSIKTAYSARPLTVGDRFTVLYTVSCPNSAKVAGPLADSLGPFLVVDQKIKTTAHQGYNDHSYRVTFAGFRTGDLVLPPLRFLVQSGARTDTLAADSLRIAIASVLTVEQVVNKVKTKKLAIQEINDIKPAIAFPNYWLLLVPAALALLAMAAYLGYVLARKLRRIRELAAAPPPPWDEALAALDELPVKEWLAQGQFQRYYYSLSEITKRYLERRFAFNAVEQTTTEIVSAMKREKTPLREEFGGFLTRADMVKYAKFVPPAAEAPLAIEQVRELVQRTIPAIEPQPATDIPAEAR
ncbi:MAG TPA: hypothetical protein VMF29_01615 [Candidatus Edwardsbacteria bacterium]|nr:hypothetical protein [Candidatus Edwardsbacteria bacterium]